MFSLCKGSLFLINAYCCHVFLLLQIGRQQYTPEEDAAIISCVNKLKKGIRGTLIWKKMEEEGVTCHSWQSMKYRYLSRLEKKDVDEPTAENQPKVQEAKNQVKP